MTNSSPRTLCTRFQDGCQKASIFVKCLSFWNAPDRYSDYHTTVCGEKSVRRPPKSNNFPSWLEGTVVDKNLLDQRFPFNLSCEWFRNSWRAAKIYQRNYREVSSADNGITEGRAKVENALRCWPNRRCPSKFTATMLAFSWSHESKFFWLSTKYTNTLVQESQLLPTPFSSCFCPADSNTSSSFWKR